MKRVTMTLQQIEQRLSRKNVSDEWVKQLSQDPRIGVQRLVQRYQTQRKRERRLKEHWEAMLQHERFYRAQGLVHIAGVDEVGRGPLAGPVVAAAVILPESAYIPGLNDSKQLTSTARMQISAEINRVAVAWSTAAIPVTRIDEINIYRASLEAMKTAVWRLNTFPDVLLNDAVLLPELPIVQEKIVKGDTRSVSVAAASVMAKVTRDRLMTKLAKEFPQYGFERNMGYATAEHLKALRQFGVTREHRRTFAPVEDALSR